MANLDLRRLRNFVAVAETKTISHAAQRAHLSQPALSRQMQSLEQELQFALFERTGRRLRLTAAGHDLLEHARKVLSEADAFIDRARTLRRGDVGVLRVGATPQTLERTLPRVLKRFGALAPGVDVRLKEGHPAAISEWLLSGDLELGLIPYRPELREGCRRAGTIHLIVVGLASRSRARRTIEVAALDRVRVLVLSRGFGSRELFDAACEVAHVRPNIVLESGAPGTLLSLARAGYGVAVLPTTITLPAGVAVQRLQQGGQLLTSDLGVHWDPRRHLPPYGLRFADELARETQAQLGRRG
jgi:LysR family cyn operon transcriptional activator